VISTGCYFGRSQSDKNASYVLNGMALAVGGIFLGSSTTAKSSACDGCFDLGPSDQFVQRTLGALFAVPAAIVIVLNIMTPTEKDAPRPAAGAARATSAARVTGPGLKPATVQLR
jgi:hypothetical protein